MAVQHVAEGLFEVRDGAAVLYAGRCRDCGAVAFPRPSGCPRCTGVDIDVHQLATEGTLWTFTIQGFAPKAPYDGVPANEPFGVGYVDLGGEVLVEGRLTEHDPASLYIGMPMRVVPQNYRQGGDGVDVATFAFEPVAG